MWPTVLLVGNRKQLVLHYLSESRTAENIVMLALGRQLGVEQSEIDSVMFFFSSRSEVMCVGDTAGGRLTSCQGDFLASMRNKSRNCTDS